MPDPDRRQRGADMLAKVYAGDVAAPPEGQSAFADLMLEQLFAEVWTRPALAIRERRLLIMGVIAALGEGMTWRIQLRAALKNGELTPDQARETLIQLTPYIGYPRAASLLGPTEEAIRDATAKS